MNLNKKIALALLSGATFVSTQANATLPTYLTSALTDAQTQLTELIAVIAAAAIVITLLVIGPKVVIRMVRSLASKVSV